MIAEAARLVEFLVLGGLCGFLGGLFGIGGATLAIPALGIVFGLTEQLAQGTALIMALPNVIVALRRYTQKIGLDLRAAALLGVTALPFVYGSALVATSIASRELRIGFAVFLILIALDIARRAFQNGARSKTFHLPWPFIGVVGAVSGVFSGLFGIGGAIIAVPAMTTLFSYTQVGGTGHVARVRTVIGNRNRDRLRLKGRCGLVGCGSRLLPGGVFAVRYGVDLAHRLPEKTLRLVFVGFTLVVGISLLAKAYA